MNKKILYLIVVMTLAAVSIRALIVKTDYHFSAREDINCTNECSYEGQRECFDDLTYGICVQDNYGCLVWDTYFCQEPQVCSNGYCCLNECSYEGQRECIDDLTYVVCIENQIGCLVWDTFHCTEPQVCINGNCLFVFTSRNYNKPAIFFW